MAEPGPRWWQPTTLRTRLALWIALTVTASLLVFGVAAYLVAALEEHEEPPERDSSNESDAEVAEEVLVAMAFASPVGLLLAVWGGLRLARRTLAPIEEVIGAASTISVDTREWRLPVPGEQSELREMVQAVNLVFARLDEGFAGLRRFTQDASHELRTPIAVVRNELEVALRRPRDEVEWQRVARTSLDEIERMSRLIDALLTLARADAGVTRTSREEPFDLADLLDAELARWAGAAAAAELDAPARVTRPSAPILVDADRDALACVFANILENALRYTPASGRLDVELTIADGRVTVAIDDSGPGIDPREADRIFAPFVRGSASLSARGAGRGVGLGLAISQRILNRFSGTLTTGGSPLGGARFSVTMPVAGAALTETG